MSAKASNTTDEPTHGVKIAAESSYGELSGTRHIVINGEPLCGHPQVEKHIETGRYGTETTRYPLNDFETCKTCGGIYASEHGSKHGTFAEFAEYSEDDWVQIETTEGETITGRVRRGADTTDMPSRRITVVASDEPRERWVYGVEKEVTVAVREGEQPVIKHGSVMDDDYSETPVAGVSEISEPENNIDVRTEQTMEELRDLGGDDVQNVMANGQGRKEFTVYSSDCISERELWSLLDRIYKAGYEIRYVSPASERAGDRASIGVTSDELCRDHDAIVTDGGTDRLTYLNKGELRQEIVYAVGGDPSRYGENSDRGIRMADVERIAQTLQPEESDLELEKCQLGKLYEVACRWAGGEYQPNAVKPWGINRPNLKEIHRAVNGRPPKEKVAASDGGSLCDLNTGADGSTEGSNDV